MKKPTQHQPTPQEPHLKIYRDRSVLVFEDGTEIVFYEGRPSEQAQQRYENISKRLSTGWLEQVYSDLPSDMEQLNVPENAVEFVNRIVDSVTSEVGRAVAGLAVLQLTIKCLEPQQSIRLHKGGTGNFSWREGLSMRRLDAQFITPFLRKHGILRLNSDGIFMTRSLAENYPYTQFYKAAIRGAKQAWLQLIDFVETDSQSSCSILRYLLACLRNRAETFKQRAKYALDLTHQWLQRVPSTQELQETISLHINKSPYSARLLEVAMHSFLQVLEERGRLSGRLLPLCQMRTANKKHRNIADVEIVNENAAVVEAWDAKYGKPYLMDELHELAEKLEGKSAEMVGFVVDRTPDLRADIQQTLQDISEMTETEIRILSLADWIELHLRRASLISEKQSVVSDWIVAYTESLCQKRRDRAPIDEPADQWIEEWIQIIESKITQ